jgi:DNA polymerase iota
MDVSDLIEYNTSTLNTNNLPNSFFCLSKTDPTIGFDFDATRVAGHSFPDASTDTLGKLHTFRGCRDQCGVAAIMNGDA